MYYMLIRRNVVAGALTVVPHSVVVVAVRGAAAAAAAHDHSLVRRQQHTRRPHHPPLTDAISCLCPLLEYLSDTHTHTHLLPYTCKHTPTLHKNTNIHLSYIYTYTHIPIQTYTHLPHYTYTSIHTSYPTYKNTHQQYIHTHK